MKTRLYTLPLYIYNVVGLLDKLATIIEDTEEKDDTNKLVKLKSLHTVYDNSTKDYGANFLMKSLIDEAISVYYGTVVENWKTPLNFDNLLKMFREGMDKFDVMFIEGDDNHEVNELRLNMTCAYSSIYTYNEAIKNGEVDSMLEEDIPNEYTYSEKYQDIFNATSEFIECSYFDTEF